MDFLKKYNLTDENIENIKDRYNDSIIEFIEENSDYIIQIIEYLYNEGIECIYFLLMNNIKIFLENKMILERKVNSLKKDGYSVKAMIMKLIDD